MYVCEGTKARKDHRTKNNYICSVELTNSDSKIITAFSMFLREILGVDWTRVKGQLFIYPDLEEKKLKNFWSKASKIPVDQFQKSIILKLKEGKFKANPYGTFKIRYSCKKDFVRLNGMIEEMWKDVGLV